MKNRPTTTLFMLMSVDGKISTGATDILDVDTDFPKIKGISEGLDQYYQIERTTELWSINSGKVQAKIGVNDKPMPQKTAVSFVLIDNTNLTQHGIEYFCHLAKEFVLVTTNKNHPAYQVESENLSIIFQESLDLSAMLHQLYQDYHCEKVTIQTGGTLNGLFLSEKLFDYVDIVVAPVLIGGKDTSSLIDGVSLKKPSELSKLGVLKLLQCDVLENSYLRLRYQVVS